MRPDLEFVFKESISRIEKALSEKGEGYFSSPHDILGCLEEEKYELLKAIHENEGNIKLCNELYDIMTTAAWGIISINNLYGKFDNGN